MLIGILRLELYFPSPNSLKAKRFYLKRITQKLRGKFNISVHEVGLLDKWQRSELGISLVGNERRFMNSVIDKVIDTVEYMPEVEILRQTMEIL